MTQRHAIFLTVGMIAIAAGWKDRVASAEAPLSVSSTFQQANGRYRESQFDEAAVGYQRILELGLENGALYYNLGNALLKSGKNGEALWAYLKAKAFLPRDADVRANLEYVQSLLQPGVNASVRPSQLIQWLTFHQRLATSELAGGSAVWAWVWMLVWTLSTWWPQSRRIARALAWCAGIVAAIFLTALVVQTVGVDGVPKAVVVRKHVTVKFSPQTTGTTHFTLPEGTLVQVLTQAFGWVQLKRADGLSGWAPEDALNTLSSATAQKLRESPRGAKVSLIHTLHEHPRTG